MAHSRTGLEQDPLGCLGKRLQLAAGCWHRRSADRGGQEKAEPADLAPPDGFATHSRFPQQDPGLGDEAD
jgi:hypothetical protein